MIVIVIIVIMFVSISVIICMCIIIIIIGMMIIIAIMSLPTRKAEVAIPTVVVFPGYKAAEQTRQRRADQYRLLLFSEQVLLVSLLLPEMLAIVVTIVMCIAITVIRGYCLQGLCFTDTDGDEIRIQKDGPLINEKQRNTNTSNNSTERTIN